MEVNILIQISSKFVSEGSMDNTSALVQLMDWRQTGDMPWHCYLIKCWPRSSTIYHCNRPQWMNTSSIITHHCCIAVSAQFWTMITWQHTQYITCLPYRWVECKKDVTPLLKHWSYVFFALTHQYICMLYIIFLIGLNPCGAKFILGNIKV